MVIETESRRKAFADMLKLALGKGEKFITIDNEHTKVLATKDDNRIPDSSDRMMNARDDVFAALMDAYRVLCPFVAEDLQRDLEVYIQENML